MIKPTVLYVDDMVPNINVFKITYKREYNILTAENATEAIEVLSANSVDLIISDQRMPGKSGVELLQEVAEKFPTVAKIIISEYSQDAIIRGSMKQFGILHTIHKPWDRDELKRLMEDALSR
jgi:YesN/AraC family two-component response regulator